MLIMTITPLQYSLARHEDFQSSALPSELLAHAGRIPPHYIAPKSPAMARKLARATFSRLLAFVRLRLPRLLALARPVSTPRHVNAPLSTERIGLSSAMTCGPSGSAREIGLHRSSPVGMQKCA